MTSGHWFGTQLECCNFEGHHHDYQSGKWLSVSYHWAFLTLTGTIELECPQADSQSDSSKPCLSLVLDLSWHIVCSFGAISFCHGLQPWQTASGSDLTCFRYLKKTVSLGLVYCSTPSAMQPNTLWGYVHSELDSRTGLVALSPWL